MKILSAIEMSCVFGGNSMESQNCLKTEPSNMKTVTKIFLTLIDWIVVVVTQIPMVSLYQKLTKKR
jgi:hypothetical protein